MNQPFAITIASFAFAVAGCAANVGTTGMVSVPKDSAGTCTNFCTDIGLRLSSVVIMANNVGCVCSATPAMAPMPPMPPMPPGATPPPAPATSSIDDGADGAAAGLATLIGQRQARIHDDHSAAAH